MAFKLNQADIELVLQQTKIAEANGNAIVPQGAKLTIEVRISSADIDQVRAGQSARLHFSAFNRNTTPKIPGKVIHISLATMKGRPPGRASTPVKSRSKAISPCSATASSCRECRSRA